MSKRTPYDTGKRAEPRPWTAPHRESEDDYGKVDFEDDAGGTVATLYIEQSDDRSYYTLKGYTNEPLKVEIDDQSGSEEPAEGVEPVESIHWFPGDLVEWQYEDAYGDKVVTWGVIGMVERMPDKAALWVWVTGHEEPAAWPAEECRLLRRVNKNKEAKQ